MLKPVRMCRLDCIIAKEIKDDVIGRLRAEGVAQVDVLSNEELEKADIGRDAPLQRANEVSALLARARSVIESIAPYGRGVDFLEGVLNVRRTQKREVEDCSFGRVKVKAEKILAIVEDDVHTSIKRLKEAGETKNKLAETLVKLEPVKELKVPVSHFTSSVFLRSVIGVIPKDGETTLVRSLEEKFHRECAATALVREKHRIVIAVHVMKERSCELEQVLRVSGFEELNVEGDGTFMDAYYETKTRIVKLEKETGKLAARLKEVYVDRNSYLHVVDELRRLEEERCTVFNRLGSTDKVSYLRMWVPRKRCQGIVDAIEEEAGGLSSFEIDWEPQDAPSLLENPSIFKPFEMFTRMYSIPRYNQIDPTVVTAPTFVIFTGFMIADAMYGLILLSISLLMMRRYGRYSKGISDIMFILLCCSISTIIFGVLTGS
ncbi:MAG: V-type ATPase 116kDa subunit family protein, partial [Candidatus Altiarchaeota archaeon]